MLNYETVKRDMAGACVRLAVGPELGRQHPSIRLLAETVLSLTTEATTAALDAHMVRCNCCTDRFVALAAFVETGFKLGATVTKKLGVPVTGSQALLADCQ